MANGTRINAWDDAGRINRSDEGRAECIPFVVDGREYLLSPSGRAFDVVFGHVTPHDFVQVTEDGISGVVETEGFDIPTALVVALLRSAGWTVEPPTTHTREPHTWVLEDTGSER